ncbi:hypothetical protein CYY_000659 [Polysphondylium violaceum]|uniref:Uncharacterized protein n=1 Tax=Polysphondylium violaceum TaxID=133409 RepID=A0A8J4Q1D7_9MYCE|nr:hypothetical protein CYY_000659 [Polysphondylium violaceum]
MNKITSGPNQYDKMKAYFEKCRMLNAYQSLKRNEYVEKFKERSPYLTMILDSVLYKRLHSSIKHSYDGKFEGMGRTDTILLEGILFDVNGNPIDFNFRMRTIIYGGHSDGYSIKVYFILGKTKYAPSDTKYNEDKDVEFDAFIQSCQKELCCGDTSKLQFYEVFLLLSAIFPYKCLNNEAESGPFVTITDENHINNTK